MNQRTKVTILARLSLAYDAIADAIADEPDGDGDAEALDDLIPLKALEAALLSAIVDFEITTA